MKIAAVICSLFLSLGAWAQAPAPKPLVTNGPIEVTSEDFEAFLLRVPEPDRPLIRASLERIGKAVELVYTSRTVAHDARRLGLDKDPRVQLRIRQLEEGYLAQLWSEHYRKTAKPPDLAIRAEEVYRLNKERFTEPERFTGTYIQISFQKWNRDLALKRAQEIRAKALAGADFSDLAREFTDDPNYAKNHARMDLVAARDIEKPIADAVLALKAAGEITHPVETRGAFHLVRLERKVPARLRPFAEVKDDIIEDERSKFVGLAADQRIGELKNTPLTKVHEQNIASLFVDIDRETLERLKRQATPPTAAQ